MLKYRARRDLPRFAKEYHTLSPSDLAEIVLEKRNREITPESVTMWFKRHPKVYEQLEIDIHTKELPKLEVSETIFKNGTFEQLPSVKKWIETLEDRHVKKAGIRDRVAALKRICKGHNLTEKEWSYRHPDRLTEKDFKEYNRKIRAKGLSDTNYRKIERNFLLYSRQVVPTISGRITIGKYKDLFVEKPILNEVFEEIKAINDLAYRASKFCYKTGARKSAALNAKTKDFNPSERTITVYEKTKAMQEQRMEIKYIDDELMTDLKPLLNNGTELLFDGLKDRDWTGACREAYARVMPKLNERIPMPVHFWRHMFAQHMLRATDWNYTIVAKLGGWTEEALRRNYGEPPQAVIANWGKQYFPKI